MTTAIDIGFTETVKAIQTRKGSRQAYANLKWQSEITADLAAYISQMRSVFVSTVNAQGYPYTQIRMAPLAFCMSWIVTRSLLQTLRATGSSYPKVIYRIIRAPFFL